MKDGWGKGVLWENLIKPLEVIENKEYPCAHAPSTAKAKTGKRNGGLIRRAGRPTGENYYQLSPHLGSLFLSLAPFGFKSGSNSLMVITPFILHWLSVSGNTTEILLYRAPRCMNFAGIGCCNS